jgi:hypothetical protein
MQVMGTVKNYQFLIIGFLAGGALVSLYYEWRLSVWLLSYAVLLAG